MHFDVRIPFDGRSICRCPPAFTVRCRRRATLSAGGCPAGDANVLTRGIGAGSFELERLQDRIYPGDILLLCSDGLYKMMSALEIERALVGASSAEAGNRLLEMALDRGAIDNVTIVLVKVDRN
jgi:serine/threonine protein phosphatase PrpC